MKQFIKILAFALFIMGSGLLIWAILPEGRVKRVFIIDPEISLFSGKMNCEEVQNLLSTEFTLNYPRSIRTGESIVVQVDLEKAKIDENKISTDYKLEPCGISLEVWIDSGVLVVIPGNKIIKSYLTIPSQFVKFEIFAMNDQEIEGTLWISAVFPGDTSSVLERIPIFAVPFSIQVHSLFGLHFRGIRILSLFLIFLAFVLSKFLNDPIEKRR